MKYSLFNLALSERWQGKSVSVACLWVDKLFSAYREIYLVRDSNTKVKIESENEAMHCGWFSCFGVYIAKI